VTIGLSLWLIVALSDNYWSRYFFTDSCTNSTMNCYGDMNRHSEVAIQYS